MIARLGSRLCLLMGCLGYLWGGCKTVVEVDVECPKLCLATSGPTMPGSASLLPSRLDAATYVLPSVSPEMVLDASPGPDAATMPSSLEWEAILRFNDVLAHLPSSAISIALDVRLTTVELSSTTDLSFITDLHVYLSRADSPADGGGLPGSDPALSDCWSRISATPIASYQSQVGAIGPTVELVNLIPEINLFDCIKDNPARLRVNMGIEPSRYPTVDVPLTLSTCVGARSTATYP